MLVMLCIHVEQRVVFLCKEGKTHLLCGIPRASWKLSNYPVMTQPYCHMVVSNDEQCQQKVQQKPPLYIIIDNIITTKYVIINNVII